MTGLLALVWFVVRVVPRPSRARYPCQRAALPLASAFVVWLLGSLGAASLMCRARRVVAQSRYALCGLLALGAVGAMWLAASALEDRPAMAASQPVNEPIGAAQGINPGRVVWARDANATDWAGPGSGRLWQEHVDQQVVSRMLSDSLRSLTGAQTDAQAWDALFRSFNRTHGRGDVGYQPGQKIAMKVNHVLSGAGDPRAMGKSAEYVDHIDESPQLVVALLTQLVAVAGVAPQDITIGDPQSAFSPHIYDIVHGTPGLEDVNYLAARALPNSGRTLSQYSNVSFYWSDPDQSRMTRVGRQDFIPVSYAEADYFINLATLKSHDQNAVTLCAKNHFGSLIRGPVDDAQRPGGYYNMHASRVLETPGMGHYRCLVDLMGHPQLGGKTMLYLIDGIFAGQGWAALPRKWRMAPFNGDWPESIFISQDGVAIDSVAVDFLKTEWSRSFPGWDGVDDYLHEAALANNPPSGAVYDPDRDGVRLESLGAHEHWNNPQDKQYSRNLGTGQGIELVRVEPPAPAPAES